LAEPGSRVSSGHGRWLAPRGRTPTLTETSLAERRARSREQKAEARPLLKWAGGKRQLLPALRRFYPAEFNRYWEPFLGSAAVFFDLHARGALDHSAATLTDNNLDLIACYRAVCDNPEQVIGELRRLARDHEQSGSAHYYDVRNNRFNPQRASLGVGSNGRGLTYSPALAAMFIYLNRTGYNGLFRLNSDGEFNVPAGRYAKPRICDEANVHRVARALGGLGITLEHGRFERVIEGARAGDFLYFDPPYAPLSKTARFTNYTAEGFSAGDHERLRDVMVTLATRGCSVVMSNSTAPDIAALYEDSKEVKAAGLRCYKTPARRAINSNAKSRGVVEEYVIANVTGRD
jgi:DNA adenine methylase